MFDPATLAKLLDQINALANSKLAIVGWIVLGIYAKGWVDKALKTKADKSDIEAVNLRVDEAEIDSDKNAGMVLKKIDDLAKENRDGLRRLDESQTQHHGEMYDRINKQTERIQVLAIDVAEIKTSCSFHNGTPVRKASAG